MELKDIWMWYCEQRLGAAELPPPIPVSPWQAMELFWDMHPMFTARYDAIKAVPYSPAFDEEADGALAQMAITDSFDGWEGLSSGAWRVMSERLQYTEVVILANEVQGSEVIAHLPLGLDRRSRVRALLLMFLLGGGRTIDRRLLPARPDGSLPAFPSTQTLKRH